MKRFAVPAGVIIALFSYWVFAFLHQWFGVNPVDFARVRQAFVPQFPPESFTWGAVREFAARAGLGHGAVLLWVLAVAGWGIALPRFLGLKWLASRADRFLLSFGLGMGAAMLAWLGLGMAGLWFPALGWLATAGGIAALWACRSRLAGNDRGGPVVPGEGAATRLLAWLLAAIALLSLLMVFAANIGPERFYDALVYHLACPALYVMQHKVTATPNLMHSAFPQGASMLFGWQMFLGEPATRAWRTWLFALILAAVWRMGAREGRPLAGLAAASLAATAPLLFLNGTQTSVDLEACLLVLLACTAVREADRGGTRLNWLVAAAFLVGSAYAAKITAVFWAPWLALWAARRGASGIRGLVPRWDRLALFAAVAFICVAPWLARTGSVMGNPFYPYLTKAFPGGRQWDGPRHVRFLEQQSGYLIDQWRYVPRLPWLLVTGHTSENYVGPALAVLAPLFIFAPPAGAAARAFGAVAGMSFIVWLGVTHTHRFLLTTWLLAWLLMVFAVWDLGVRRPRWREALLGLLVVLSGVSLADLSIFWRRNVDPVEMITGRETPRAFLARRNINDYTAAAFEAGDKLPPRARVMMVGETRGFWWPRPFVNHSAYDVQAFEEVVRASRTADEALKRLRQLGVTHLFFNDPETSRLKFRYNYPMLVFNARQSGVVAELWRRGRMKEEWRSQRNSLFGVSWRGPVRGGRDANPPLSFSDDGMKMEYEGWSTVTFTGGEIAVQKNIQK